MAPTIKTTAKSNPTYSCMDTCKQATPCGNRYCSAHPQHIHAKTKKSKQ